MSAPANRARGLLFLAFWLAGASATGVVLFEAFTGAMPW